MREIRHWHMAVLPVTAAILLATSNALASNNEKDINGVALSKSIIYIERGLSDTLTAMLLPDEVISSAVEWNCDDPAVADVENGIVKGLGIGTATVTVTTTDGGYKAACTVNVRERGTKLNLGMPGGMPPSGENGGEGMMSGGGGGMPGGGGGMPGGGGGMPGGGGGMPGGGGGMPGGGGGMPSGGGGMPGGGGMMRGGGGGMPGGGPGVSDTSDATDENAYLQTEGEEILTDKEYSSTTSDAPAVKVSGGTLTLNNCNLIKNGGDTSNSDGSSFYGINSAVLANKEGSITINGGTITTDAIGANGIVAYGGTVDVSNVTISCSNRLSRGIHATGGGTITAHNLNINTRESNSSVIALDRGGGDVTVFGGTYSCLGNDCAVLYSTGNITVNNIKGSSLKGEIGVIEGNNIIAINNSDLVSHATSASRGLMILQSGSGDAGDGLNGIITVAGGSLTMTDNEASLIEIVTNVTGKVTLDGVKLNIPSGILMTVDYNKRWKTKGATGVLVLSGEGTTYEGSIVTDSHSSAKVTVNKGVVWQGAYDNIDKAKSTELTINGGTWTLTDNSNVDSITIINNGVINKNGYKLNCRNIVKASGAIND